MANANIATITTEVGEAVGAMQSATVLITGFQALLDAAVAAAIANGATEAELAPLSQLSTDLDTNANALASAVAAHPGPAPTPSAGRK